MRARPRMSHRLIVCTHPFALSVIAVVIQARETGLAQPRRATLQAIVLDSYTECKDDDALHHSSFTRDVHAHTLLFRRKLGCRGQLRISRSVHRCAHRTMRTPHHAHTAPCAHRTMRAPRHARTHAVCGPVCARTPTTSCAARRTRWATGARSPSPWSASPTEARVKQTSLDILRHRQRDLTA